MRPRKTACWAGLLMLFVLMSTAASSGGAGSNVNVTFTVASTTSLDASGCATNSPDRTTFGTQVGVVAVTTQLDCSVLFGATDTSTLRMYQADGGGNAMRAQPSGNVVSYWPFNDDYLDRGSATATIVPDPSTADPAFVAGAAGLGNALDFDGNDLARTPHIAAHALDVFTLDAWFNTASIAANPYSHIATKQVSAVSRNFNVLFDRAGNTLAASVSFSGVTANVTTPAGPWVGTGWHHVAVTVDAGGTLVLYVDGVERNRGTFAGNVDNPAAEFKVGDTLVGSVDEVRLQNVARTAADIKSYFAGSVDDYANLGGGGDLDWSSGAATRMFGVCLRTVAAGATTTAGQSFSADSDSVGDESAATADCGDGDTDPWRPIAAKVSSAGSRVAFAPAGTTNAAVHLRFGTRTSANQPPGTYVAPLVFEVVSPDVPNSAPLAPALVTPSAGRSVGVRPTFVATFDDPDVGQTGQLEFEVCTANPTPAQTCAAAGGSVQATGTTAPGIADATDGQWVATSSLTAGTRYWRARGIDSGSLVGAWSTARAITVSLTPIVQSTVTSNAQSSNSIVLARPTGLEIGDVLVAQVASDDPTTIFTPPAGWTLILDAPSAQMHQASYYHVVDGTEPATFTWGSSVLEDVGAGMHLLSGVNTTTPIDAQNFAVSGASGTSATTPSITTTVANTMLIAHYGTDNGVASSAVTAPLVESWDTFPTSGGAGMGAIGAIGPFVGPGATGAKTATIGSSHWIATLLAVRPQT